MNFLPTFGGIENNTADFRAAHALEVRVADLVEVLPGGMFGGPVSDQFDDRAVGGLDMDIFRRGVVDGGDGSVGVGRGIGQF